MDINKKRDLEYIKGFQKITLASICRDLKIDKPSVYKGSVSAESLRKIKEEIQKRIKELEP